MDTLEVIDLSLCAPALYSTVKDFYNFLYDQKFEPES